VATAGDGWEGLPMGKERTSPGLLMTPPGGMEDGVVIR